MMNMTWDCLSTEFTAAVCAINLRSDQGVRARVELCQQGASVVAQVTFEGSDAQKTWAACQRATTMIFDAAIVRAALSARPPDLHLVSRFCSRGVSDAGSGIARLKLAGADARVALAAAFGESYAEAAS